MNILVAVSIATVLSLAFAYIVYKLMYRVVDSHPQWWRKPNKLEEPYIGVIGYACSRKIHDEAKS